MEPGDWFQQAHKAIDDAFERGELTRDEAIDLLAKIGVIEQIGVDAYDEEAWRSLRDALLTVGVDIDGLATIIRFQDFRACVRTELLALKRWATEQNSGGEVTNPWARQVEYWCRARLGELRSTST